MDEETPWKEPTDSNVMEQMQTTNKWSSISNTVQKEEVSYKERRRGCKKKTLESKKRDTNIRGTERKNHTQQAWREEKGREDEERNNLS
jgi:hypothetical protein